MEFRKALFPLVEDIKITLIHYKESAPAETDYEKGRRDAMIEELEYLLKAHYLRMEEVERRGWR